MNQPRSRTRSAGVSQRTSMTGDVHMLQDTVVHLQQQLLQARNDNNKVKDQLNCLITLVQQAWTGDRSAVLHVANIVGVAAPEISRDSEHDENHMVITAKPKSRSVNNWARLTVGLLNRSYCHLEREAVEKQRHHLLNRQSFLEGQVEKGYVRPVNHNQWEIIPKPTIQPPPTPVQPGNSHHITQICSPTEPNMHAGTKKPTMRHLYRPANQKTNKGRDPNLTWSAIVPNQQQTDDCLLNTLNKNHVSGSTPVVSYIDPNKYNKYGLFEEGPTLNREMNNGQKRPMSCKDQRQSDVLRSRPKSAVLPMGERPLKYETTRPISAAQRMSRGGLSTVGRRASTGDLRKRPKSCKSTKGKTFLTNQQEDENTDPHIHDTSDNNVQPQNSGRDADSDSDDWDSEAEERAREQQQRQHEAQAILVKIKRPESIDRFQEDVLNMEHMEQEFKEKTISLQKKLGISPDGLVL